ncbi:hypothetical protein [Thiomonas sp.]
MVIAGLALISPWLALAALFLAYRGEVLTPAMAVYMAPFREDRLLWWGLPAALIAFLFLARHPFPPDDLLRDMTAWAYHYDYRRTFWGSPRIPHYDQYLGFDLLAGWVYRHLPTLYAPLVFQFTSLALYLGLLSGILARKLKDDPLRWTLIGLAIALSLCTPVLDRIVEGRPEMFFALWTLAAFLADGVWMWVWLAVGLTIVPWYWLAGAYAPAFLALPGRSLKFRLGGTILFGLAACGIWMGLSHGLWWHSFIGLRGDIQDRVYGVTENEGLSVLLQDPVIALALVSLLVLPWNWRKTQASTWLLLAWFCLPWMMRYIDLLAPLGLILLAEGWNSEAVRSWSPWGTQGRLPETRLARVRLAGFLLLLALPWRMIPPSPPYFLHIPGETPRTGVRVLSPFGPETYDTLYANPGVRLAPAMEPGMTRRSLQRLAQTVAKASCAQIQASGAAYLIEDTLTATKPCLKLVTVNGPWALWKIERKTPHG